MADSGETENKFPEFLKYKKKVIQSRIIFYTLLITFPLTIALCFYSITFGSTIIPKEYVMGLFTGLFFLWVFNFLCLIIFAIGLNASRYLNIINDILIAGNGNIKLEKKSPFRSNLDHGINDPSYIDFSTNNPDLPKLFFMSFNPSYPHFVVFIPFDSTDCVLWSKQYISLKKDYETQIKELINKDFKADIITSNAESPYTWSPFVNVLTAVFHKNNYSSQNIINALKILNKIDLIINKKPSIVVPIDVKNQEKYNYSFLKFYRCRNCDNLVGIHHKDRDGNIFKNIPNECNFCNIKGYYEEIYFYSNHFINPSKSYTNKR